MNKKNHEAAFIPCGDSMEKMEEIKKNEISEEELEQVSGGTNTDEMCTSGFESMDTSDGSEQKMDLLLSGSMLR